MTAKAKRSKKNTAYSTHEYVIVSYQPTGGQMGTATVLGSREAFHRQTEQEQQGFLVTVRNVTTDTEEYRSPALTGEWGFDLTDASAATADKIVDVPAAI